MRLLSYLSTQNSGPLRNRLYPMHKPGVSESHEFVPLVGRIVEYDREISFR